MSKKLIKDAEKYLNGLPKIYLKTRTYIPVHSGFPIVESVYVLLVTALFCDTVYLDESLGLGENTPVYCDRKKRRSVGDIYRMLRKYSNNSSHITLEKVYIALNKLILDGKVISHTCPDVHKRVYMPDCYSSTYRKYEGSYNVADREYPDEFGVYSSDPKNMLPK